MTLFLSDLASWWCSLDCVVFIGVLSFTLILEHLFVVFYLQKVHGPTPSIFAFSRFSVIVPYVPTEVQVRLLRLHFLGCPRRALLARPWIYLESIPSASLDLVFLWRLCFFLSGRSWARLTGVSAKFFGALSKKIPGVPWRACPTISFQWKPSSPREINGIANRLVLDLFFGTGWFPHPICCVVA